MQQDPPARTMVLLFSAEGNKMQQPFLHLLRLVLQWCMVRAYVPCKSLSRFTWYMYGNIASDLKSEYQMHLFK